MNLCSQGQSGSSQKPNHRVVGVQNTQSTQRKVRRTCVCPDLTTCSKNPRRCRRFREVVQMVPPPCVHLSGQLHSLSVHWKCIHEDRGDTEGSEPSRGPTPVSLGSFLLCKPKQIHTTCHAPCQVGLARAHTGLLECGCRGQPPSAVLSIFSLFSCVEEKF